MSDERVEELELTESDLEFAREHYQRMPRRRLTEEEVARMRERVKRDRDLKRRFDTLRKQRR